MHRTLAPSRNGYHRDERPEEAKRRAAAPLGDDYEAWQVLDAEREAAWRRQRETEAESPRRGGSTTSSSGSKPVSVSESVSRMSAEEFFESVVVVRAATPPPPLPPGLLPGHASLAHTCFVIQRIVGDGEFFYLDSRRAGLLVGVSGSTAWRWLGDLCAIGILEPGEKGNQRRSNRYRLLTNRGRAGDEHAGK